MNLPNGYGDGYIYGHGDGYGVSYEYGNGVGYGDGHGYGDGYGHGHGHGYGYGYGDGYGNGYGDGDGYGHEGYPHNILIQKNMEYKIKVEKSIIGNYKAYTDEGIAGIVYADSAGEAYEIYRKRLVAKGHKAKE